MNIKLLIEKAGATDLGADLYGGPFIGAIRLDFLEKFAKIVLNEHYGPLSETITEKPNE